MYRIKHCVLTIAAIFGVQLSSSVQANTPGQDTDNNEILDRIAKIQQESQAQGESPKFIESPRISQWNNWSDWQNWQNWQNWYN